MDRSFERSIFQDNWSKLTETLNGLTATGWKAVGGTSPGLVLVYDFHIKPKHIKLPIETAVQVLTLRGEEMLVGVAEEGDQATFHAGVDDESGHLTVEYSGPYDVFCSDVAGVMVDLTGDNESQPTA
jgi:hypothetical protein